MMDPFGVLLFFPGVILVVVVVFVIVCAAFAFTRPAEQCRAAHAGLGLVAWSSAIVAGSMIEPWLLQAWLVLTSLFLLTLAFVPDKLATLGASGGMMVAGIAAMAFVLSMMDVRTPPEFEHIGAMGTMGLVLLVQLVALLVNLVMMPRRGRNDAAG
jgi:hypothetical protein